MNLFRMPVLVALVCICFSLLAVFFHTFKLTKISYEIGEWFFYFSFPCSVVLLIFALRRIPIYGTRPLIIILFMSMLVVGNIVSVATYGSELDLIDITADNLRLIFVIFILSIYWGRNIDFFISYSFIRAFVFLSALFIVASLALMFLFNYRGISVYFGLQSVLALSGLAYGLVYKKNFWIVFSLVLVVLSGKRGVYVAYILTLLFYFLLIKSGKNSKLKKTIFLFFMFIVLILSYRLGMVPESILNRFQSFFDPDINWRIATAGRNLEVIAVAEQFSISPLNFLYGFGMGAGFVNSAGVVDSTIHISPIAIVFKFGVFYAIAIYGSILIVLKNVLAKYPNTNLESNRPCLFWLLVFVGELGYTLTTFTFFQSFILWLAFSVILSYSDRR